MKLQAIFDSITPQNIKDIPLLADAMEIFINNLENNSSISADIREVFSADNTEIRENLLKIYISSLYSVISNIQQNKDVQEKFREGEGLVLSKDITEILNDEYFTTNKEYKQRIGTKLGIDYTYLLAKYLQTNEFADSDFDLTEIKPFHFQSEGSIYRELYENVVKPLSHPIGFTYIYNRLIKNALTDLFGVERVFDINTLEVRCLNGYYDVFTPDSDDTNVKADFLTRINALTGEVFTEAEYNTYVNVNTNKVIEWAEFDTRDGNPHKEILFTDGTYLESYTNPIRVYYRNYIDEVNNTTNYINQYTSHCSLYVDYTEKYVISYTDNIDQFLLESNLGESSYTATDAQDDIFLLSIFSDVGYYFFTDEADNNDFYFKCLDYYPDELDDNTYTVPQFRQIKYVGSSNGTAIANNYYIFKSASSNIDIGTTDFTNIALWEHVGTEPKHDWYLITQS